MVIIASHPGYLIIGRLDKLNDVHHSGDKRRLRTLNVHFKKLHELFYYCSYEGINSLP